MWAYPAELMDFQVYGLIKIDDENAILTLEHSNTVLLVVCLGGITCINQQGNPDVLRIQYKHLSEGLKVRKFKLFIPLRVHLKPS